MRPTGRSTGHAKMRCAPPAMVTVCWFSRTRSLVGTSRTILTPTKAHARTAKSPVSDAPIKVQCLAGCGWIAHRRREMIAARPCPWCDAAVEAWQEPPLVFRAARAVEAAKARATTRFLCPPSEQQPEPQAPDVAPIYGFTHRIWVVSEGRYETHTIPPHCRKGAKKRRLVRRP